MFRFQSTPSARRATGVLSAVPYISGYFNPRPPRGGRPGLPRRHGRHPEISIHALREEGDPGCVHFAAAGRDFNPRPPRGGRPKRSVFQQITISFQSTPSARRATGKGALVQTEKTDFNPRPPRGGRPGDAPGNAAASTNFNPRPPRGGRPASAASNSGQSNFNPRPPRGGRQFKGGLGGGDLNDFNPRPPRGGRLCTSRQLVH